QCEADAPADRSQGHVHRTGPLHADAGRVRSSEILNLVDDFASVAFVAGQTPRLAERREVLAASELPRQLDVGIAGPHRVELPFAMRKPFRKAQAADRIETPVDWLIRVRRRAMRVARHERSAAEQIELVR